MKGILSRLAVITGTLAMIAALSAVPVSAVAIPGPTLRVFNPNTGDTLPRGALVLQGAAWDATAKDGSGVDRVSVYAGDRDAGGIWLGTVGKAICQSGNCPVIGGREQGRANFGGAFGILGVPNPVMGGQFAMAGWTLKSRLVLKKTMSGSFFFYARSSVTGVETVVTVDNLSIDPGRTLGVSQP